MMEGEGGFANDYATKNCRVFLTIFNFLGISSIFQKKILVIFENFLKIKNVRRTIFKYVTE